ncbi:hypothetical protein EHS13_24040 [Paenibacillus psychroresistens]|uniref:Uncharacterized protein n=1 Tax=Paenibacillus psychroresistens TaxID=1778678 RepID=A0A6B8RPG3_9BACL|nr:hypothetical protein [Paenibacillus psychroresistens]QGQ97737.1 hypothetical protein EHS13_24040 [Paenibacillus psychroresistens]
MKSIEANSKILRVISESGQDITVNFDECNENWIAYNKRNHNWTGEEYLQFKNQSKCIGQRDVCAKPPYFEFFTKPFTKVELKNKKEFLELQKLVQNAGWSTFDMS